MDKDKIKLVQDLPDEYELVTDSQDIAWILESVGLEKEAEDYGCLFVKQRDGEYLEILGVEQAVPYNSCRLWSLYDKEGERE